jgi:DNA topoisomerase VI subunit A
LGLQRADLLRYPFLAASQAPLNEYDRSTVKRLLSSEVVQYRPLVQRELEAMLRHDAKMELEAILSQDASFLADTYLPEQLQEFYQAFSPRRNDDKMSKYEGNR